MDKEFRYGTPVKPDEMPRSRKRHLQYDECLEEFLDSGQRFWRVNLEALPSRKPRVILSSLKWRIRKKEQFRNIKAFMSKNQIYLESEKTSV
jgi:hypothetical protein